MERHGKPLISQGASGNRPAIRLLVRSALSEVMSGRNNVQPGSRPDWVAHLADALISPSEAPHRSVLSSLIASGVSSEEILQRYVPDAARRLGEQWCDDAVSFVDVTIGAARLQKLFHGGGWAAGTALSGTGLALGHSVLMIAPRFEQHSLGAFVVADDLRRRGFWVHMALHLHPDELVSLIAESRFSMLGLTLATAESLGEAAELVDYIRGNTKFVTPVVIGGRVMQTVEDPVLRCGADHAAANADDMVAVCNLPSAARADGPHTLCG